MFVIGSTSCELLHYCGSYGPFSINGTYSKAMGKLDFGESNLVLGKYFAA